MAENLGRRQSEASLDDKFAYKELLYPGKGTKKKD